MNKIKKFFVNKEGKVTVVEMPNLPIILWFVFLVLSKILHSSNLGLWAGYISSAFLLIWAILEIGWGDSYFRRTLGIVVLSLLIISRS
jgi:hypothetical protein